MAPVSPIINGVRQVTPPPLPRDTPPQRLRQNGVFGQVLFLSEHSRRSERTRKSERPLTISLLRKSQVRYIFIADSTEL